MIILSTLFAYLIDLVFGEIKQIKHPVRLMGDYITFFTKHFYKNSILQGSLLAISLSSLVIGTIYGMLKIIAYMPDLIQLIIIALIASTGIASNMLYNSVKEVIECSQPKEKLAMLVTRDTQNMSSSDIYKASIETYSENTCDGIIAPLLYLLIGGLYGLFVYKAISTLDSMVGYKTTRFINFGKASAKLDDILNFIPSRITALMFCLFALNIKALKTLSKYAKKHESPNAGYPISAMALCLGITLGGSGFYHGQFKEKALFGFGRQNIEKDDVLRALQFKKPQDIFIIGGLGITWIILNIVV